MKTLLLIVVFLCSITNVFYQSMKEIDSLKRLVNNINDRQRSDIHSRLGWLYFSAGKHDSSLYFYHKALEFPQKESSAAWRGNVHLGIGSIFLHLDQWDSSLFHLKKSVAFFESESDSTNLSIAYGNISILYNHKNLYEEALGAALRATVMLENGPPSFALAACYNNIGSIHKQLKNYRDAKIYYRKALGIRIQINQPLEIAKSYNNLGDLFTLIRQHDSAKHYLQLSANIKRKHGDTQGLARTLTRLGKVLMLTGEFSSAETLLKESLRTQRQVNDVVGMIETLNNLGELYLQNDKLATSSDFLQEGNIIIRSSGTPEYLRQNLELRIELARKQKDFATGMTLLDELLTVRDSLLNQEKSKTLQAMQIRYETQKKEQAIVLLQQREEVNQARIIALIAGLILVAAIGILIYINLRNARAAKQRFELLLSETRHRIKNNLQTLASIFHLQTIHFTDHDMVLEAQSSESRVHAMSLLHEKFYGSEAEHINTQEYITDLVQKLVDIYGSHTSNLKVSLNIKEVDLDIDKALALSLIIQEIVCNAFKYAFDHEPNPTLTIEVYPQSNDVVTIISDNGIGLKRNPSPSSQGLTLVDALVSQLDGKINITNHGGTTFTIRFPGTSLWKRPAFL